MEQLQEFALQLYTPIEPYLQEAWIFLKPYVLMLLKPIFGPINGFHIILFIGFIIQNLMPVKGPKVHVKHILSKTLEDSEKLKKRIVEDGAYN
jgi:hypothetical protein